MSLAIVTGSSGLIGSETVKFLISQGLDVIGIDNNLRAYFFGADGDTLWNTKELSQFPKFRHFQEDIRNKEFIDGLFQSNAKQISLVVHCAAQPSHDWAAKEPHTDFTVNAMGTLNLLEATRLHAPDAVFIFTSTNKVYGDTPNELPLVELEERWEVDPTHRFAKDGIDESMSIDQSKHSVFGASKVAADIMCQEYGRYFGLKTAVFRGGCLTGPAHSGAALHGFLSYLVKCQLTQRPYVINGYKGKQVRDNIHSHDLVMAFWNFYKAPRSGEVYNIGGGRFSNCSMIEAIKKIRTISGFNLDYKLSDEARQGDHIWWISDVSKFKAHYPAWQHEYSIDKILKEIVVATAVREKIKLPIAA